jgi:hypothetical protein
MPQRTKPSSMSLSEWRLWCCCHPAITPPSSSLSQRGNVSLEEFDPGNRWSTSPAHERRPSTPLPPSTPKNSNDSTPPAVSARRADMVPQPLRVAKSKPKTEDRAKQRPTTVLLPSPPQRPSESRESKIKKGERSKPQFVRQDSEHWWQVGKRMLERKDKDGSSRQDSGERK